MPYLKLFHGREHPDQQLDDWGEPGPVFGPFPYFHTTYAVDIKFDDGAGRLLMFGDLIYYDRMFYGEWSVFDGPLGEEDRQRLVTFEMEKAQLPEEYRPAMR